jgi:hypothetical protein
MTELPLNRTDAEAFLAALDPAAEFFTFQTFDDARSKGGAKFASILHGTLAQHWGALARLNDRGVGVFITVNETDGKGRTAGNIKCIRALFIDPRRCATAG